MRKFENGGSTGGSPTQLQVPQNQLLQLAQILAGGNQGGVLGALFGSSTTTRTTDQANAYTQQLLSALMPQITGTAQADAVVQNILDRARIGFAPVLGAERQAGLYNSSTRQLMANDAMGRAVGESAGAVLQSQQQAASTAAGLTNEFMRNNRTAAVPSAFSSQGGRNALNLAALLGGGGAILNALKGPKKKSGTQLPSRLPENDANAERGFDINEQGRDIGFDNADNSSGFDINAQGADIGFDYTPFEDYGFSDSSFFDFGGDNYYDAFNLGDAGIGLDYAASAFDALDAFDFGDFSFDIADFVPTEGLDFFFANGGHVGSRMKKKVTAKYANGGPVRKFANGGLYSLRQGTAYDQEYDPSPAVLRSGALPDGVSRSLVARSATAPTEASASRSRPVSFNTNTDWSADSRVGRNTVTPLNLSDYVLPPVPAAARTAAKGFQPTPNTGWSRASVADALDRLSFTGGRGVKGAVGGNFDSPASRAFGSGAVLPVSSLSARLEGGELPTWGGESGYGALTDAQRAYVEAANMGGEASPRFSPAAYSWSQSAPSFTSGAPVWADGLLNQSAYNTGAKLFDQVPQYYDLPGNFNRYDTEVVFSTQDPGANWLSEQMGFQYPQQVLEDDWYGVLDTTVENWWDPRSNALRFQYRPQTTNDWGEFLQAASIVLGGAMAISGFAGSSLLGDLGSSLGFSGGNAAGGLSLPTSLGGSAGGLGLQLPASLGGTAGGLGLTAPASALSTAGAITGAGSTNSLLRLGNFGRRLSSVTADAPEAGRRTSPTARNISGAGSVVAENSAYLDLADTIGGSSASSNLATSEAQPSAPVESTTAKADGGLINGPGTGTSDSIPGINVDTGEKIAVSNDEYIIPADVVRKVGTSFFDRLLAAFHTPVRS